MESASNKIVSVLVVTCGVGDYLKHCLDSLDSQTYKISDTVVINNSLNLNFAQEINNCYPNVKVHSSPKNLFFAEALNKGIKMSRGDFLLCLNDDVVLDKRFIELALKGFSLNPKIGIVSGKVLRIDAKTLDSTGLFLSIWRTAKERGYGQSDIGQYEKEGFVFGVTGAAAFYRRRMLEKIKVDTSYFDVDYHIFYEDLDLAWRAQNFGWKAYYLPQAVAYHFRGATVRPSYGIGRPFARRYLVTNLHLDLIKNRYLTIIKNESFLGFLLHLPFILLYDFAAWAYILFFKPGIIARFILSLRYLERAFNKRGLIKEIKAQNRLI